MEHLSGKVPATPQEKQQLESEGFLKCRVPHCEYMISPQEYEAAENDSYYFKCPSCKITYQLMASTPFAVQNGGIVPNPDDEGFGDPVEGINRNWETFVGLTMKNQGDIGEDLVKNLKTLGDYGPITSWSKDYNDPIDGTAGEWAIEVKTVNVDALNHRFVPGGPTIRGRMIERAKELGCKGILGILVMLDYRKSVADIYGMEMPLDPWTTSGGRTVQGPVAYRKHNGQHLIAEVPFKNPFMNPAEKEPVGYNVYEDIPF